MQSSRSSLFVLTLLATLALTACGDSGDRASAPPAPPTVDPEPLSIEESDLLKLRGNTLYVQNPQRGLAVVDVTTPRAPRLLGRGGVTGAAGELYLRGNTAIVILKEASPACTSLAVPGASWTPSGEIALVDVATPESPTLAARYCTPGKVVTSRLLGNYLYLVTSDDNLGATVVFSVDVSWPSQAKVVQTLEVLGDGKEIFMTPETLFVAAKSTADCTSGWCDYGQGTRVSLISLSAETGALRRRGSAVVEGEPQGRFHMDARSGHFRIVTYEPSARHSLLSVLDISNPDQPKRVGKLQLGHGERLYATRFVGHRAYVVTFRQTDPLWVVDLEDPAKPKLLGELHVPGWSDFLFPRGDGRLLAVGRGDRGRGLGVSLFDVSDPRYPQSLRQITIGNSNGGSDTVSEANVDHRAVTVIENAPGTASSALLVVPYSVVVGQYSSSCRVENRVQLVDVGKNDLALRGQLKQKGLVRRSLLVKDTLVTISDYELLAADVADRDRPRVRGQVQLGDNSSLTPTGDQQQQTCYAQEDYYMDDMIYLCTVPPTAGAIHAPPLSLLALFGLFVLARYRRARSRDSRRDK